MKTGSLISTNHFPMGIALAVVLLLTVGAIAFFFWSRKRRKLKRFYEDLGLHSEEKVLRQGTDRKTKALAKIHYPKFKWRDGNLHLYGYNYSKTSDYFETKLEAFNTFFGKFFFKVEPHPTKGVVFYQSKMPDSFVLTEEIADKFQPFEVPAGFDDYGKLHTDLLVNQDLTIPNSNHFTSGRAGSGKTTFVLARLWVLLRKAKIRVLVLAPKNSYNNLKAKFGWDLHYFDCSRVEQVEAYLSEIQQHKAEIEAIRQKLAEENVSEEEFFKFVQERKLDYTPRLYLFDDASAFLKAELYGKDDELKAPIQDLIREINTAGRLYRYAFFLIWVISHSAKVDEVGLSPIIYSTRVINKVENDKVSQTVIGTNDLISPRLGKSCFFDTEKYSFLRTPFINLLSKEVGGRK